jgi:hypothetical protein
MKKNQNKQKIKKKNLKTNAKKLKSLLMKWKMESQFQCNVSMLFVVKLAQNKQGWGIIPN